MEQMETQPVLEQQAAAPQTQASQEAQSQQPPLKVVSASVYNPEEQAAPAQTQAPVGEQPDEKQVLIQEIEALKSQLEQAPKEPQVKVEYKVPDELKAIVEDPQTVAILAENYTQKPIAQLIKEQFRLENPWATSDAMVEKALRRQYPDIDFDIPENLGLPEEEFAELSYKGEAFRKQQMDSQAQLKGKIEAAMNIEPPAPFDEQAFQQEYAQRVEAGLNELPSLGISLDIPGYSFPALDVAKIREEAYKESAPLMMDPQTGLVWPNMEAIKAQVELAHLKAQIPAMLEAAKRAAPISTVQAINQTLNNQAPLANAAATAPITGNGQSGPRLGGLKVVGVSKDF